MQLVYLELWPVFIIWADLIEIFFQDNNCSTDISGLIEHFVFRGY